MRRRLLRGALRGGAGAWAFSVSGPYPGAARRRGKTEAQGRPAAGPLPSKCGAPGTTGAVSVLTRRFPELTALFR